MRGCVLAASAAAVALAAALLLAPEPAESCHPMVELKLNDEDYSFKSILEK